MSSVLDWIDPARRRIGLVDAPDPFAFSGRTLDVIRVLRTLGFTRYEACERGKAGADHRWSVEGQVLSYEARFPLDELVPTEIAFYGAAALATAPAAPIDSLLAVHLAVYEICVNVHDHGRPLPGPRRSLGVGLRMHPEGISVRIVDGCERFDPLSREPVDVRGRARDAHSRGYGITLVRRAIDGLRHDHGPDGNVVSFSKGIASCPSL